MIEQDEYEAWREHPTTRLVFKVLLEKAEERKQLWLSTSWSGDCDNLKLVMLRGQAEAFKWLPEASFAEVFGESE